MKAAIISDIHGNAEALEAVLEDIKSKGVRQIFVLGDLAYRGPEPERVMRIIRDAGFPVLKGNADEWVVRGIREKEVPERALDIMQRERDWCVSRLEKADLDYLQNLPETMTIPLSEEVQIHAFHAAPDNLFRVVLPDAGEDVLKEQMSVRETALTAYGHIHLAFVRYIGGRCLFNPGSVGLPFDGVPMASYALAEAEGRRFRVTVEKVPYDVEKVVRQYRSGDYPNTDLMEKVVRHAISPFSA